MNCTLRVTRNHPYIGGGGGGANGSAEMRHLIKEVGGHVYGAGNAEADSMRWYVVVGVLT